LRTLSEAGVSTGVAIAPLIPGLNDHAIAEILRRAREAGAQRAFMVLLRLSSEVRTVFEERLHAAFPERAKKVLSALSQMRPRGAAESSFGTRFQGAGPRWEAVRGMFDVTCRRLGFREHRRDGSEIPMGPVQRLPAQPSLFDAPPRHP
jgi:DNA repair photolyase